MSESQIQVTSQLTLEREAFKQEMGATRAEVESWANDIGNLHAVKPSAMRSGMANAGMATAWTMRTNSRRGRGDQIFEHWLVGPRAYHCPQRLELSSPIHRPYNG
jgi:hypothetical protein